MAYAILIGKLAENDISNEMLATLLEIHRNTVTNKLRGKSSFTIGEATLIRDTYFPGEKLEYLFKKKEES